MIDVFRIAICDKDIAFRDRLREYISRDTDIDDDYAVECFDNVSDVKSSIDEGCFNNDLMFLMVDESGKASMALVEYIRKKKCDLDVFFVADTPDYINEAFHCRAFNYIIKPVEYNRFVYEMKQYLTEKRVYQKDYLSVNIQGKEQMIPLNAVHYFVSDVRKIGAVFYNDENEIWFYGKLDDLEKRLGQYNYIRCHQSYLVNGNRIEDIRGDEIITSCGRFQISRKYTSSVRDKWDEIKKKLYDNANIASINNGADNGLTNNIGEIVSTTLIATSRYTLGAVKYGTIIAIRGLRQNVSYRLYDNDETVIGRDGSKAHIVINDNMVSRCHCSIRFSESEQCYYVIDCSTNGTYVSGIGKLSKNQMTKVVRDSVIKLINGSYSFVLV